MTGVLTRGNLVTDTHKGKTMEDTQRRQLPTGLRREVSDTLILASSLQNSEEKKISFVEATQCGVLCDGSPGR